MLLSGQVRDDVIIVYTVLILWNTIVSFDTSDFVIETCPVSIWFCVKRFLPLKRLIQVMLYLVIEESRILGYVLRAVYDLVTCAQFSSRRDEVLQIFLAGLDGTATTAPDLTSIRWLPCTILNITILVWIVHFSRFGCGHCLWFLVSQILINPIVIDNLDRSV